MSAKTVMSNQIQMKNKKKYSIERNTCPVPKLAASVLIEYSRSWASASSRSVSAARAHYEMVDSLVPSPLRGERRFDVRCVAMRRRLVQVDRRGRRAGVVAEHVERFGEALEEEVGLADRGGIDGKPHIETVV